MAENDIIIYTSKDGKTEIGLTKLGDKIWLTQPDIAKLFGTSVANISTHIKKHTGRQGVKRIFNH